MSRYGDEGVQALEWAYGVLSADAELAELLDVPLNELPDRVWEGVAPAGTTSPWIILTTGEAQDVNVVGAYPRLMSRAPLTVKAVGQVSSYSPLAPIARRLYAALHGVTNAAVAEGGRIVTVQRQNGVQYPEQVQGIQYRHLGHLLQVNVE